MFTERLVRAQSLRPEPEAMVEDLKQQFLRLGSSPAGIILFRGPAYDDQRLASALLAAFDCPVASCTTAGEIFDSYGEGGAVGVAFSPRYFAFHQLEMPQLASYDFQHLPGQAQAILDRQILPGARRFGLLLVDGLSILEESLVGQVHRAFQGIPMIGGSAGDNLAYGRTRVLCNGHYQENAATFTVVESLLPFETLRIQHFECSSQDLVITRSDPARRIVYEIDGAPAARQLASLLNIGVEELSPQVFSKYPMMLQIGEEWYVRSVQKVNPDGSLSFFCAIDDGLPLTLAHGVGLVETLNQEVERVERDFARVHLTLGVDCVLRRLEIQENALGARVEPLLHRLRFCGFSSYGEQFQSLHVNQTLTAVVLGEK